MIKINPYLSFNGNCREAMTFYKECFGGELTMQTFGEAPSDARMPAEMENRIMHSMLENNGFVLMATDMQRPDGFRPGNDVSIALTFDNEESIRRCYKKLSRNGEVLDELSESFWGSLFGVVRDSFGKVWMMDYEMEQVS